MFVDYEIKREDDRIHKVFQDPTGNHLIVSMATSKEAFYIGRATGKRSTPKPLPKLRGHLIESVAWNKLESTDTGTGPILLGTNTGTVSGGRVHYLVSLSLVIRPHPTGYQHRCC